MKLDKKVAIITGGASGIGRATALLFAREGAKVVIADWTESGGKETVELIHAIKGEAIFVQTDVNQEADVERMVKTAVEHFGRVDIVLNNAGIEGIRVPSHELPVEEFDRVISINLRGVFLGAKHAIRQMLKNGGGNIINMASIAALIGLPKLAAYSAAKGGVANLTRQLAMEYARDNIRVNCICPGFVMTPMLAYKFEADPPLLDAYNESVPVGHIGIPEDIAKAALYLASDDSSFVTGIALPVEGGYVGR